MISPEFYSTFYTYHARFFAGIKGVSFYRNCVLHRWSSLKGGGGGGGGGGQGVLQDHLVSSSELIM